MRKPFYFFDLNKHLPWGVFFLLLLFVLPAKAQTGLSEISFRHRSQLLSNLQSHLKETHPEEPSSVVVMLLGRSEQDLSWQGQERNFFYLSGRQEPELGLLLLANKTNQQNTLYLPKRNFATERWTGPKLGPGGFNESGLANQEQLETLNVTGFDSLGDRTDLDADLVRVLRRDPKATLFLLLEKPPLEGPLPDMLALRKDILERYPATKIKNLTPHIQKLRLTKSDWELAQLKEAIRITTEAQIKVMSTFRAGQGEWQAEATLEFVFRNQGGDNLDAFSAICGSGPNSCILHYLDNNRRTEPGELMVMDIGSNKNLYAADITRTIPTGPKFSPRQKEIYNIVLEAQAAGMAAVKPGATLGDVHRAAKKVIVDAGYGPFFFHGTSHWLGLDVHDVGARNAVLKPGMVLTVEPGIYLADENLGVRIEDDLLVTKTGYEILSNGSPRTIEDIEALRAKAFAQKTPN